MSCAMLSIRISTTPINIDGVTFLSLSSAPCTHTRVRAYVYSFFFLFLSCQTLIFLFLDYRRTVEVKTKSMWLGSGPLSLCACVCTEALRDTTSFAPSGVDAKSARDGQKSADSLSRSFMPFHFHYFYYYYYFLLSFFASFVTANWPLSEAFFLVFF